MRNPSSSPLTSPPTARKQPFEHTEHGVRRPDPYHWMRDTSSPEVLAHLAAERDWYDSATAHLSSLAETLRSEMSSRLPATDVSVSWLRRSCSYYTRHPAGSDYVQLLRDFLPGGREELLLETSTLADESGYLDMGLMIVSPDEQLLAYSFDTVGDEIYRLRFRDLTTGKDLDDEVPRSYYGGAWAADSSTFFYTVHDDAYRPHQLWRHTVGTPADEDFLVLAEDDVQFELSVRACRTGDLVVAWSISRDTTEAWVIDAHRPTTTPRSVGGRRRGVEYHAEHARRPDGVECLLVVTNDNATEFRLVQAPVPTDADGDPSSWREVLPERSEERLERVDAFAGHVVVSLRVDGVHALRVLPVDQLDASGFEIRPMFAAGTVEIGSNDLYDASTVTVVDQSYVHPPVWSDVDLDTGARTERHRHVAPEHDPDDYVCEIRSAAAPDGEQVPLTVVRRRDTPLDGSAPALLYGYGAYEYVFEPHWDPALPSLLDRGAVFAHAHVRGGGEGGRRWWLDGRLGHKQNTFTDHFAVADALDGLVDGARIVSRGLSAGGLLQAAVFSQRPDRWRGVVAEVPFVDVVTTMFDASIPLTANEWDEWGDPRRAADFDWMLAYSPVDNPPPAGGRPDLLVTGAVHDPRVMVWEPAKWVAELRETDPDWSPRCVFRCELGAGSHVGPSGRFGHLHYEAEIYAWVLDRLGRALS